MVSKVGTSWPMTSSLASCPWPSDCWAKIPGRKIRSGISLARPRLECASAVRCSAFCRRSSQTCSPWLTMAPSPQPLNLWMRSSWCAQWWPSWALASKLPSMRRCLAVMLARQGEVGPSLEPSCRKLPRWTTTGSNVGGAMNGSMMMNVTPVRQGARQHFAASSVCGITEQPAGTTIEAVSGKHGECPSLANAFQGQTHPSTLRCRNPLTSWPAVTFSQMKGEQSSRKQWTTPCSTANTGPRSSKARGRPITLSDGRQIPGPQPVRDAQHVMGFNWLQGEMKARLRKSNAMAFKALNRGKEVSRTRKPRHLILEHPKNSWLWEFSLAKRLENEGFQHAIGSCCCFGGAREKRFSFFGTSDEIAYQLAIPCPGHRGLLDYHPVEQPDGRIWYPTEEEAEYPAQLCAAYAFGLKNQLIKEKVFESIYQEARQYWYQQQLEGSTGRLRHPDVAKPMATYLARWEPTFVQGTEAAHLHSLLRQGSWEEPTSDFSCRSMAWTPHKRFLTQPCAGGGRQLPPTGGNNQGTSMSWRWMPWWWCPSTGDDQSKSFTPVGCTSLTVWCAVVPSPKEDPVVPDSTALFANMLLPPSRKTTTFSHCGHAGDQTRQ